MAETTEKQDIVTDEDSLRNELEKLSKDKDRIKQEMLGSEMDLNRTNARMKEIRELLKKKEPNGDYTGKWIAYYDDPKKKTPPAGRDGEFFHIKECGPLMMSPNGAFYRECDCDVYIIVFNQPAKDERDNHTSLLRIESNIKKRTLWVKHIAEINEEEVKLQVKLAMHMSITDFNRVLEHKLVYNVKELDAVSK